MHLNAGKGLCLLLKRQGKRKRLKKNKENKTLNLGIIESFGSEMKTETYRGRISIVHMRKY